MRCSTILAWRPQPMSMSSTAWHSARCAISTKPYSSDRANVKIDVAGPPQIVIFGKSRKCRHLAVPRPRAIFTASRIFGERPELEIAIKQVARPGMKIELFGENVLVAEIVAEAGERRRIVERQRPQSAILGKVDGQMAGDAGTAAIADEDELIAGIVRIVGGLAHPLAARVERQASATRDR